MWRDLGFDTLRYTAKRGPDFSLRPSRVSELFQQEPSSLLTSDPSLLDRLRAETNTLHKRLEDDLNLIGTGLSVEHYRHTLARFYGFYRPLEEQIFPRLPLALRPLFEGRRKTAKLERDLTFLRISPNNLPNCPFVPDVTRLPDLLGSLYVTEGATLGGQLISRHIETILGLRNSTGYEFFSGYGAETGSRWKSFRTALLDYSSPQIDSEIVRAAQTTFKALHLWLCADKVPA